MKFLFGHSDWGLRNKRPHSNPADKNFLGIHFLQNPLADFGHYDGGGGGGGVERIRKERKFVTKIFFQIMLSEVLKIGEK